MKTDFRKEIFYLLICAIPFIYLGVLYDALPQTVPTHFDINGKANGWSSKQSLWFMPCSLTLGINLLLLFLPKIDPKRRLKSNQGKFEHIRFVVVLFICGISCFVLYVSAHQNMEHMNKFLFAFLGLFFATLGNFFPSLKPNYFIGIRSPWALENETVWKKTHQLAGKLWVTGGLALMILAFVMPDDRWLSTIALPLIIIISLVPVLYSFIVWRNIKKKESSQHPL
jgi:uncharacterized membrane protein